MTDTMLSQDEAQIRQLMADQESALGAKDAERLISRYAPGAVTFDLAPPLQHTGAEVHDVAALRKWLAGFDGPMELEMRDLSVTVGADVAFAYGLNRLSATPRGTTERFDLWFRYTVGLRKVGGSWRITHEHQSTPFYMDDEFVFKAATDLEP